MLALKSTCLHPSSNKPYIVSSSGGVDNSPEGAQVPNLPSICFVPQTFPPTPPISSLSASLSSPFIPLQARFLLRVCCCQHLTRAASRTDSWSSLRRERTEITISLRTRFIEGLWRRMGRGLMMLGSLITRRGYIRHREERSGRLEVKWQISVVFMMLYINIKSSL